MAPYPEYMSQSPGGPLAMTYLRYATCPHSRWWAGTFLGLYALSLGTVHLVGAPATYIGVFVCAVFDVAASAFIAPALSYGYYVARMVWIISRRDTPFPDPTSGPTNLTPTKYTEKEPRNV